jgi:hypothetical protein
VRCHFQECINNRNTAACVSSVTHKTCTHLANHGSETLYCTTSCRRHCCTSGKSAVTLSGPALARQPERDDLEASAALQRSSHNCCKAALVRRIAPAPATSPGCIPAVAQKTHRTAAHSLGSCSPNLVHARICAGTLTNALNSQPCHRSKHNDMHRPTKASCTL